MQIPPLRPPPPGAVSGQTRRRCQAVGVFNQRREAAAHKPHVLFFFLFIPGVLLNSRDSARLGDCPRALQGPSLAAEGRGSLLAP